MVEEGSIDLTLSSVIVLSGVWVCVSSNSRKGVLISSLLLPPALLSQNWMMMSTSSSPQWQQRFGLLAELLRDAPPQCLEGNTI